LTPTEVLEEKLAIINPAKNQALFRRHDGQLTLAKNLKDKDRLKFVFKGTRDNQLFLNNSVYQKMEHFRPVYDWFKDTLKLITPDSRFGPFDQYYFDKENLLLPRRIIMIIYLFFGFASTFAYLILSWSKIFLTFE
jgi:hypothetical protein